MEDTQSNAGVTKIDQELTDSYINYVRVALAVTIIKNKPNQQSVQAYVAKLREGLENQQQDWKEKYSILRQEIVTLKQQKALVELCSENKCDQSVIARTPEAPETPEALSFKYGIEQNHKPPYHVVDQHYNFLYQIASIKKFISGDLVINNSAAFSAVVDTYIECLRSLTQSLNEKSYRGDNSLLQRPKSYRELVSCMVKLLKISVDLSRCSEIQTALEEYFSHCLKSALITRAKIELAEDLVWTLRAFSAHTKCCDYICQIIIQCIQSLTHDLDSRSAKDLVRIVTKLENIPIVTELLLTISKSSESRRTPLIAYSEERELKERLERLLTKFPLFSIHLQYTVDVLTQR